MSELKITERGWAGHFIGGGSCKYHRNTLIENGRKKIIVSTVGNYQPHDKVEAIGYNRYYETMAFKAQKDGEYWEVDVSKDVPFTSEWSILAESAGELPDNVDTIADKMHDKVVAELSNQPTKEVK